MEMIWVQNSEGGTALPDSCHMAFSPTKQKLRQISSQIHILIVSCTGTEPKLQVLMQLKLCLFFTYLLAWPISLQWGRKYSLPFCSLFFFFSYSVSSDPSGMSSERRGLGELRSRSTHTFATPILRWYFYSENEEISMLGYTSQTLHLDVPSSKLFCWWSTWPVSSMENS